MSTAVQPHQQLDWLQLKGGHQDQNGRAHSLWSPAGRSPSEGTPGNGIGMDHRPRTCPCHQTDFGSQPNDSQEGPSKRSRRLHSTTSTCRSASHSTTLKLQKLAPMSFYQALSVQSSFKGGRTFLSFIMQSRGSKKRGRLLHCNLL